MAEQIKYYSYEDSIFTSGKFINNETGGSEAVNIIFSKDENDDNIFFTAVENEDNNTKNFFMVNNEFNSYIFPSNGELYNNINYETMSFPFYPIFDGDGYTVSTEWLTENIDNMKNLYSLNKKITVNSPLNTWKENNNNLFISEATRTTNSRGDIIFTIPCSTNFNYDNYDYEVRINGSPTKFFSASVDTALNILKIIVDSVSYEKYTGLSNYDYITLKVQNKFNYETYEGTLTQYINNMPPFISYDKMIESPDDITINCRFDVSVETQKLSRDTTVDISRDYFVDDIIDYLRFSHKRLFLPNNGTAQLLIENISDDITYIIGKDDIIINNEYYETVSISKSDEYGSITWEDDNLKECLFKDGEKSIDIFVLKPNSKLLIKLKSKNLKETYKGKFTIHFIKMLNENKGLEIDYNNYDSFNEENIDCNIIVNLDIKVTVPQYSPYTDEEKEILSHIITFDKSDIVSVYDSTENFSFTANNNVIINEDSSLNSEELKNYIKNGGDLSKIDELFTDYDLICYGVIIDFMTLSNPNVGYISAKLIDSSRDIEDQEDNTSVIVCNKDNGLDNYIDAFNKDSMIDEKTGGIKMIVHDTVYNLFNFCNKRAIDENGIFENNLTSNSLCYVPTMNFELHTNSKNIDINTTTSKLFVDYLPTRFRFSKQTTPGLTVWTIWSPEKIESINQEKIINIYVREKEDPEISEDDSFSEGTEGFINDSNIKIKYPEFIDLNIALKTTNGSIDEVGYAEYEGTINFSSTDEKERPIFIEITDQSKPKIQTEINGNERDESGYGRYDKFLNCEFTDDIKTIEIVDDDGNYIKKNGILLEVGQKTNIKAWNSQNLIDIPEEFGKIKENILAEANYIIWYLDKNEKGEYIFRSGSTQSTNLQISITAIPLISKDTVDTSIYKDTTTIININSPEIKQRNVMFLLLKNSNSPIININENLSLINSWFEELQTKNNEECWFDSENSNPMIRFGYKNILRFDMKDIIFAESGIDFSYEQVKNILLSSDCYQQKYGTDNTIYGIEVIAQTVYNGNIKCYNSAIITNYFDRYALKENEKPKLNRLNGSLYHTLSIINKNETIFDYKIIVDDIERNEGDIIENYTNEKSLHKFRLYYKLKESNNWELGDNFEGVIDGTKPIQPKLIDTEGNYIPKYPIWDKSTALLYLTNFDYLLSEYNFYNGNINLTTSIELSTNAEYKKDYITIKGPQGDNSNDIVVNASNRIYGTFIVENNGNEKVRAQVVPHRNLLDNIVITTSLTNSNIIQFNGLQPIYILPPNSVTYFYILFKDESEYNGTIELRFENNIDPTSNSDSSFKPFEAEDIKWVAYELKIKSNESMPYNIEILKELTPYLFYTVPEESNKKVAEYYPVTTISDIENIIDFNNFNKSYLYKVQVYLDDILILDSNKNSSANPLLISENKLKYYLFNGHHNITIITYKFNGLTNYNSYYVTIRDRSAYDNTNEYNYWKGIDDPELNRRKKLILRNDSNKDIYFENELFMNNLGHVSITQKDEISNNDFYLYRITEDINKYMNFSKYLIESNYILKEKLNQDIIFYRNFVKEKYDYYVTNGYLKLSKNGDFDNYIKSINRFFESYDNILMQILNSIESEETKKETININVENPKLYFEDNIENTYKVFFGTDITDGSINDYKERTISFLTDSFKENTENDFNQYISSSTFLKNYSSNYIKNSIKFYLMKGNSLISINDIDINSRIDSATLFTISFQFHNDKFLKFLSDNNSSDKAKILLELTLNGQKYFYIYILENLKSLIKLSDDKPINIFENTYDNQIKTIENNSSFDVGLTLSLENNDMNAMNNIFFENIIVISKEENEAKLILKANSKGRIHFKRDNIKQLTLDDKTNYIIKNDIDYNTKFISKNIKVNLKLRDMDSKINYTDYYYWNKEITNKYEGLEIGSFNFNYYNFKGFLLSSIFENNDIINFENNILFDKERNETTIKSFNEEYHTCYFTIINDTDKVITGNVYINPNLNIESIKNTFVEYCMDPITGRNKTIYSNKFILLPNTKILAIFTTLDNNTREITKNDFISLNIESTFPYLSEYSEKTIEELVNIFYTNDNRYPKDCDFKVTDGVNTAIYKGTSISYMINSKKELSNLDGIIKYNETIYFYPEFVNHTKDEITHSYPFLNNNEIKFSVFSIGYPLFVNSIIPKKYPLIQTKLEEFFIDIDKLKNERNFEFDGDQLSISNYYDNILSNDIYPFNYLGDEYVDIILNNTNGIDCNIAYKYDDKRSIVNNGFYLWNKIKINNEENYESFKFTKSYIPIVECNYISNTSQTIEYFKNEIDITEYENNTKFSEIRNLFENSVVSKLKKDMEEAFVKMQNISSMTSLIQVNLNKQKKILSTKATVNEYKNWLYENTKEISKFSYRINEFLYELYKMTNKIDLSVNSNNINTKLHPIFYTKEQSRLYSILLNNIPNNINTTYNNQKYFFNFDSEGETNLIPIKVYSIEQYNFINSIITNMNNDYNQTIHNNITDISPFIINNKEIIKKYFEDGVSNIINSWK